MSTNDSTQQFPEPAESSGSDGTPAAGAQKKQPWGFEVLLVFPLIALLNTALSPLFSAALSDRLPVVLEFTEPTALTLDGVDLAVEGVTTLSVPLSELSAWAIGQFIAAKAIWIVGVLVAT
ncbi:MAG TPA: hypothetical protein VK039_06595 [Brevibacterium sp.]|nr:hypothetical protein [Brevibacterium sp.]